MLYSPAEAMAKAFSRFTGMGKKYGIEWWILVVGAIIVLAIISMALFAGSITPFSSYDQNTGPQLVAPGGDPIS